MREEIMDKVNKIWNMLEYPSSGNMKTVVMAAVGVMLLFGLLNVFLGFRLMRFWMMLGSVGIGLTLGIISAGWIDLPAKTLLAIGGILGIILAVLSFFIYNWGIFVIGAGLGGTLSIYFLQPTTSLMFFLCILFGVGIGLIGMKFSKVIIIVGTSLVGGGISGYAIAYFGGLAYVQGIMGIPYGIALGIGIAVLGIIVQFATNKSSDDEEEEEEDEDEEENGEERIRRDEFGRKYRE